VVQPTPTPCSARVPVHSRSGGILVYLSPISILLSQVQGPEPLRPERGAVSFASSCADNVADGAAATATGDSAATGDSNSSCYSETDFYTHLSS
jgi:hypothetical protein